VAKPKRIAAGDESWDQMLPTSSQKAFGVSSATRNVNAVAAGVSPAISTTHVVFCIRLKYARGADEGALPIGKVCLSGKTPAHRLAFTLRSYSRRCGVADVLRDETKEVWGVVYELLENELENLDKDEDFNPGRPDDQNEYTRENHYVWREGDAKRLLLVALYRGHPQPNPPFPDFDYKNLSSQAPNTGSYPPTTF